MIGPKVRFRNWETGIRSAGEAANWMEKTIQAVAFE
jgi:hypothetical protein